MARLNILVSFESTKHEPSGESFVENLFADLKHFWESSRAYQFIATRHVA